MTRREKLLAAAVLLLIGILLGIVIGLLLGGDDDGSATATTTQAPTTQPPTTQAPPPTTASSTSTSTTSTSTTSTTSTSTTSTTSTTAAPPSTPVANAVNGEILGLPLGSPFDEVMSAMIAIYGEPDNDTGWNVGCPLDGGTEDDERRVWWGNLAIRFFRDATGDTLAGWGYQRGAAGVFDPDGPTPDDIAMDSGVAWNQTIGEVASAVGGSTNIAPEFPLVFVNHAGEADYRAGADVVGALMDYVGHRASDICE